MNLIFASDWQKFVHRLNWRKAYTEAEHIFLTIAISCIMLSTTGMKTRSLPRSP